VALSLLYWFTWEIEHHDGREVLPRLPNTHFDIFGTRSIQVIIVCIHDVISIIQKVKPIAFD
jgi:hypothetical protein